MKIKNEYVQVKIGNKTWTKQNMILNTYLYALFNSQINKNHDDCYIDYCFIKLNEPIQNVNYDSEIYPSSFDFGIYNYARGKYLKMRSEYNKNNIKLNYYFGYENNIYITNDDEEYESHILNSFLNRKIMGIGFGKSKTDPIYAYLDTSNMNMVINYGEQFIISRVDNIQSDGLCVGYDYPLHLVNDIMQVDHVTSASGTDLINSYKMAQLYSVGFGNVKGLMEQEYLIGDVQTDIDNNSITFNIQRDKILGHYPSEDLQLGFYPTLDNSKYLIFKYRLYRKIKTTDINDNVTITYEDLDEYYTMNMSNETFGNLNIKLKLERS